ncbi:MAG: hypothetical protein K1W19_08635 [Lachnospiraceae bacterium]
MKEHAIYFAKNEFYQIIRNIGGSWNDSKERPIVCLIKSVQNEHLYWAIPIGNYEHRTKEAKERIQKYIDMDKKNIQSCFYHIGNTNEKSIFFISDVIPITDKYIDREYLNKTKSVHIIKNKVLLKNLEYKLSRILSLEKSKPNFFRQHITDVKNYLIKELS